MQYNYSLFLCIDPWRQLSQQWEWAELIEKVYLSAYAFSMSFALIGRSYFHLFGWKGFRLENVTEINQTDGCYYFMSSKLLSQDEMIFTFIINYFYLSLSKMYYSNRTLSLCTWFLWTDQSWQYLHNTMRAMLLSAFYYCTNNKVM